MKKMLLLYLSPYANRHKNAVAATLSWLAADRGAAFDVYYDAYRLGVHFGGGDPDVLPFGHLTGGLVAGGRHLEEFYLLAHKFDIRIVAQGDTLLCSAARNIGVPFIAETENVAQLYRDVFAFFDAPPPTEVVVVDSSPEETLLGLDAYLFPEIYFRRALGVDASLPLEELRPLFSEGTRLYMAAVGQDKAEALSEVGCPVEAVETISPEDTFCSITTRIARRWYDRGAGWLLGDPVLVSYWLPRACEEKLLPIYGKPQTDIIASLSDELKAKGRVVHGRQFDDRDFFELSRREQCLQVVDPSRPPFSSIKHLDYQWKREAPGFFADEPSDEMLEAFAESNKVLISIVFWSGMIRELENLYNLVDLATLTKLRAGLVLTAQSFEYMRHSPMELLTVPLDHGGCHPCLEPLLGSCGIGVAIESLMSPERLAEDLRLALGRMRGLLGREDLLPRGWWGTMDVPMFELAWHRRPLPVKVRSNAPFVRVMYQASAYQRTATAAVAARKPNGHTLKQKLGRSIRGTKLASFFEEYRPYDFYRPGRIQENVVHAVKSAGLEYMFTKSGFGSAHVQYLDERFVALNYNAGRWDGWTPFLTINDVSDLKSAEGIALRSATPGWIVGTVDSCLWTFGGSLWERSNRLLDIARFVATGGDSSKLVNVTPHTLARYARLIEERRSNSRRGK
ncbi:MAG: hypothetical protein HYY30_10125 [Chloroflexi bacterium]|nr:hypothetical protein [Chloroflexota bacterium]